MGQTCSLPLHAWAAPQTMIGSLDRLTCSVVLPALHGEVGACWGLQTMGRPEEGCLQTLVHSISFVLVLQALGCLRMLGGVTLYPSLVTVVASSLSYWCFVGGDASLSVCLWRAGYAFTDPGYSFYHPEVQAFDPGAEAGADLLSGLGQLNRKDYTTCGSTCVVRQPFPKAGCPG